MEGINFGWFRVMGPGIGFWRVWDFLALVAEDGVRAMDGVGREAGLVQHKAGACGNLFFGFDAHGYVNAAVWERPNAAKDGGG